MKEDLLFVASQNVMAIPPNFRSAGFTHNLPLNKSIPSVVSAYQPLYEIAQSAKIRFYFQNKRTKLSNSINPTSSCPEIIRHSLKRMTFCLLHYVPLKCMEEDTILITIFQEKMPMASKQKINKQKIYVKHNKVYLAHFKIISSTHLHHSTFVFP